MAQAKAAVAALDDDERGGLAFVGITLDPVHDTPEVLAELARAQGLEAPLYRFATGDPAVVDRALDAFGVKRVRDPETGVIDHANLFILIDRGGEIAYRLTIDARRDNWLLSALRALLREVE